MTHFRSAAPAQFGKTGSHGCVRLAGRDALELARLVEPGEAISFRD